MAVTDIATRTYNHGWRLDPIVRSLLDTDFYKLLMLQMIRQLHPGRHVDLFADQPHHARASRRSDRRGRAARPARSCAHGALHQEGADLAGRQQLLRRGRGCSRPTSSTGSPTFRLPEYELRKVRRPIRAALRRAVDPHHDVGDSGARDRQRTALARGAEGTGPVRRSTSSMRAPRRSCGTRSSGCASCTDLRLSDFGTRRRHGFLWQRWCVEALKEGLGARFIGTSNVLLAMDNDLEAIGTNAHELPMVARRAGEDDAELREAPYRVLEDWQRYLWRQSAGRAARRVRHRGVPARCARLGGGLDRLSPRQRAADRRRRTDHRLVEGSRAAIPREKLLVFSDAHGRRIRSRRPTAISTAGCG